MLIPLMVNNKYYGKLINGVSWLKQDFVVNRIG